MQKYILSILLLLLARTFLHAQQSLVIEHVNIITMDKESILSDQTIIVEKGIIKSIGKSGSAKTPRNAKHINGTGKYLMPGFTDMHAHFFYEQGIDKKYIPAELKIMLANGVTTARIMNGCALYMDAKDKVSKNILPGPELFVASPQFVGAWPWADDTISPKQIATDAVTAAEAVKKYKQEGYDEIKITFFIKQPAYDAIIKTAGEEHIKVTGHVGHDVKLPAALAAKQQIEHLDEFVEMLLPDSSSVKTSVSGPSIWSKKAWETVDYLDENKIPALIQMVKDAGIYVSPTNYFFKVNFGIGQTDTEIKNLPDYNFIPGSLLEERRSARSRYWDEIKIDEQKRLKWYGIRKKIIKGLNDAGVKLLCGSDSPEWYMVQGFSVHHELGALAEAGLSNYDALKTTTINPCKYLGISDRKGAITVGKEADFVLLEADPLDNISNTGLIDAVFTHGHFYDKDALKKMLNEALQVKNSL